MTADTFFRWIDLDITEIGEHAATFDLIRRGELHAVAVRDVYRPDDLAAVIESLERHDPPFVQTWFPPAFKSWFYGRNLNLQRPDLSDYFADVGPFTSQFEQLFGAGKGIERLSEVLSSLDHGRPFVAAPGPAPGQTYMFTTIRAHLEGGFIPPHFDNEYVLRPSYQHLQTQVEPRTLSFVVALSLPVAGGALEVYDLRSDQAGRTFRNDDRATGQMDLAAVPRVSIRIPPGCMVVFDSGRYLHAVTPVQGNAKRWTLCSFMALSRDGQAMYCWG